jgi:hypothetical protein
MSKKRLYIAYGSNLNLLQMANRCPTAKPMGTVALNDYELLFREGVATVAPREGDTVPVLVWDIKPTDEIALDHYEGYPHLYGKKMMDVILDDRAVSAMAYVMTPGHAAGYPSEYYLNVIAEGYKSAGFDLSVLDTAVERTKEIMAQEIEQLATDMEQVHDCEDGSLLDLKWW